MSVMPGLTTVQGQPVSRLGFATQYPKEAGCIQAAFVAGINYYFFYSLPTKLLLTELQGLLAVQRQQVCISTGIESRNVGILRAYLEQVRRSLQIDQIDVFFAEYVSPSDDADELAVMVDELQRWKAAGLIRYIAASTHNREVALQLIQQNQWDSLMLRYNMAHRKVEEQVLPAARDAGIPIIAFTCTRWGALLTGHPQWQGAVPTAADCYRYVLQHPAVQMALTAPKTRSQLAENLAVLQDTAMTGETVQQWQQYGDLIYGNGQDAFETQWV